MQIKMIAIGASAGGISAFQKILSSLRGDFQIPIVMVQHLSARSNGPHGMGIQRYTSLKVREIEDKMPLEKGGVYLCPPGYHVLLEKDSCFALSVDEPVHFSRPSIDVFFESAASVFAKALTGVLLTGANEDGALGLFEIKKRGGITIVQSPQTAELSMMPSSAIKIFQPDLILDLAEISAFLNRLMQRKGAYEDQHPRG
ncbi:MAG: chemotaxis protein CheB [Pseudobdellovibrionaceae bacterium]